MLRGHDWLVCGVALMVTGIAHAEAAPAPNALARMPVKEITVFKDGHAFVLHEGAMPVDQAGTSTLDYLPRPVLGTFWPYSAAKNARLASVVAARKKVAVEREAQNLAELLEANPGAEVIVTEVEKTAPYSATIVGFPKKGDDSDRQAPPGQAVQAPPQGQVVLFRKAEGVKVVALNRIQDVVFTGKHKTTLHQEEFRNLLTLRVDWQGAPEKTANVGMMYLQKGIRWIPNYKVEIDGNGKAVVQLQGTIVNELVDLDNVTCHLVVGVPTFAFQDSADPIALNQALAQLSQHFDPASQTVYALSNAIMTQNMAMNERIVKARDPLQKDLGPEIPGSAKNEDLFIYTVKGLSLKKGERAVVPVGQFTMKYRDIYVVEVPFGPPGDAVRQFNVQQQAEVARLMNAPKFTHKIRLSNTTRTPLTTAPAVLMRNQRILSQGMMTYTPAGGSSDLTVTTAVDIKIKKSEKETKRTADALNWRGHSFARLDMSGTFQLANFRDQTVEVEVVRFVVGEVDSADNFAKTERVSLLEGDDGVARPAWWGWYQWGYGWDQVNGVSRATWNAKIEPGKTLDLGYTWHYFWN
jgi:hypothetical protein